MGENTDAKDIIKGDEVTFHNGPDIKLPQGITYSRAFKILQRMQEEAETIISTRRLYPFRPFDGAVAASTVMKRMFGITIGVQSGGGFFSPPNPPETRPVKISATESIDVPWGKVEIPALDQTYVMIGGAYDPSGNGIITHLDFVGPKKNTPEARAFLDAVGKELESNSIYKGKAIVGTDEPEFLDLSTVKPEEIIFSDEVMSTLEGTLWSVLRHREVLKADGVRIKRALLLEGPYGTGKTSAGQLTALEAVAAGWTFIAARPGKDDINEVLHTAKLYAPAVVFIEDVDNQTATSNTDEVAKLLETFDGITSKGSEIALLMTTNHFERIHKGMLRPGRIDAVVEVAALDRNGVERLIKAVVNPSRLSDSVDYDKVYEAMRIQTSHGEVGFYPAFIREALERAKTFAVGRLKGSTDYVLDTADLIGAAQSLHGQLKAQQEANEGEKAPTFDSVFSDIVSGVINGTEVRDYDGDKEYTLATKQ
ncbi:ATP-binding protein [Gordonia bronchialis]|uniref:AAA family ATPase n=1 Tax=Gordonia bronchialis TaxID=2054 RepID=UPI001CBF5DBD|nr:ATP-binding protein [Gordonia bronchialis]UAK38412.1 ATP-binding protein [Gordonia bronchialis]